MDLNERRWLANEIAEGRGPTPEEMKWRDHVIKDLKHLQYQIDHIIFVRISTIVVLTISALIFLLRRH